MVNPPPGFYQQPVQFFTQSYTTGDVILYDYNLAFAQLLLEDNAEVSAQLKTAVEFTIDAAYSNFNDPFGSYYAFIDITPFYSLQEGGYIYVEFQKTLSVGSAGLDFRFIGNCQADYRTCANPCTNIVPVAGYCEIQTSSTQLIFDHQDAVVAGKPFRLRVKIQNPLYISRRDIRVYVKSKTFDQRTVERGEFLNAVEVTAISIIGGSRRTLWGIKDTESIPGLPSQTVGSTTYNRLFKQQAASPLTGPLNSVYIGFRVAKSTPAQSKFTVKVYLFATGVLEGSIVTNLPAASAEGVKCKYVTDHVACFNVGFLLAQTTEYFLATKAFYASSVTTVTNYGKIQIVPVVQDEFGTSQLPSLSVARALTAPARALTAPAPALTAPALYVASPAPGVSRRARGNALPTLRARPRCRRPSDRFCVDLF